LANLLGLAICITMMVIAAWAVQKEFGACLRVQEVSAAVIATPRGRNRFKIGRLQIP
jgi:hypothetical protein